MKKEQTPLKPRPFGLYNLAFERIEECKKNKNIIPFPVIFEKICRGFSITKKEAWELLYLFRDLGKVKIVCGHGVEIL